ncbi:MAG TPA: flavodoxin domain-containing protein [Neobacillus sp.]|jgi:menaquinone-dependent protoporphyrinogen oxidase
MTSLIVYCSSHGTTEKAVSILSEILEGEVYSVDLKQESLKMDLSNFDNIIIGGSIHAGNIQRKIKQFIRLYHDELMEKWVGLFLCCMKEGDSAIEQFNNAFPVELRKNSVALGLFGGEFLFSKMNYIEKQIVKKVTGVSTEQSNLDVEAIKLFASKVNNNMKMPV